MKEIIRNHSKGKFTIHLIKDQDFMIEYFYDNVKLNDLFFEDKSEAISIYNELWLLGQALIEKIESKL